MPSSVSAFRSLGSTRRPIKLRWQSAKMLRACARSVSRNLPYFGRGTRKARRPPTRARNSEELISSFKAPRTREPRGLSDTPAPIVRRGCGRLFCNLSGTYYTLRRSCAVNFNVQGCPGRWSFGGDFSSSYYLAAFGRDNTYLGGLNTYGDLSFRVTRVPAIPEPSILVIRSLVGPLGVTMGRRILGDNRFRVFASGPSAAMWAALVIRDALRNEPVGRVAPGAGRSNEAASGRNGHVRVCLVLGLFLSKLPIVMPTSQGQSARVKAAYPFLVKEPWA